MGWSREAVKNYKSLNKIDKEAWEIIGTGFKNIVPDDESDDVPESGTGVPKSYFSENLLRNILDLDPGQQVELCGYLAKGKDKKGHKYSKADFKNDAVWYRAFNILWNLAEKQFNLLTRIKIKDVAEEALREWSCYRGSIICYLIIIVACYRSIKTGSNDTPRLIINLIQHGVLRDLRPA